MINYKQFHMQKGTEITGIHLSTSQNFSILRFFSKFFSYFKNKAIDVAVVTYGNT